MLPAGGDGVVEVGVGLLPRLVDAPGRVRLAEEEALRADPHIRPDAGPPVGHLRCVCNLEQFPMTRVGSTDIIGFCDYHGTRTKIVTKSDKSRRSPISFVRQSQWNRVLPKHSQTASRKIQ